MKETYGLAGLNEDTRPAALQGDGEGRPMMDAIEAMVGVWALTNPDMTDVVELIDRVTHALWSPRERAARVDAAVLRNVG